MLLVPVRIPWRFFYSLSSVPYLPSIPQFHIFWSLLNSLASPSIVSFTHHSSRSTIFSLLNPVNSSSLFIFNWYNNILSYPSGISFPGTSLSYLSVHSWALFSLYTFSLDSSQLLPWLCLLCADDSLPAQIFSFRALSSTSHSASPTWVFHKYFRIHHFQNLTSHPFSATQLW